MGTRVFFIEETDRQRLYLRRYISIDTARCAADSSPHSYCQAMFGIGDAPIVRTPDGYHEALDDLRPPRNDPRWPTCCDKCRQPFNAAGEWQLMGRAIYRRPDNGAEFLLEEAPAGAVWNAWWIADRRDEEHRGCG